MSLALKNVAAGAVTAKSSNCATPEVHGRPMLATIQTSALAAPLGAEMPLRVFVLYCFISESPELEPTATVC
jgi:hypothetical protein